MVPDGRIYHGRVDYQGNRLSVYLDTTGRFERPALIVDSVDIGDLIGLDSTGTAWMGFTSATGRSVERHELLSWRMSDCSGLVATTVEEGSVRYGVSSDTRIVPMPSRDAARLFSTAMSGEKVTVTLGDVTGLTFGVAMTDGEALRNGFELPFHPSSGTYYIRISDGLRSISMPWVIVR